MTSAASPSAATAATASGAGFTHYRPSPRLAPGRSAPTAHPVASSTTNTSGASRSSVGLTSATTASPQAPSTSRPQYADAGTQYSPDGLPPTASASKAAAAAIPGPAAGSTGRNKRKQSDPSPEPMLAQPTVKAEVTDAPPQEPAVQESTSLSKPSSRESQKAPIPDEKRATAAIDGQKKARTSSKPIKVMPRRYETCDPKDLGVLIADMLMELIRLNDKIPLKDGKLTRFHSRAPPGISCHDYLNRLIQHATLSPPILLSMVYYIDKLCAMYPAFTVGSLTVHRFLITAATVAAKGLSDSFWTNSTYARIGGISTGELATLELDFLQRVEFRIVPQPETLVDYYYSLVQRSSDYVLEDEGDQMDEDPS